MITAILAWLAQRGISERAVKAGSIAIGFALLAIAACSIVKRHDAAVIDNHEAPIALDIATKARAADAALVDRQQARTDAQETARKEFDNATATLPDEGLTTRQRLDICLELRDSGTDTNLLPECVGIPPRAQAGSVDRHPSDRQR